MAAAVLPRQLRVRVYSARSLPERSSSSGGKASEPPLYVVMELGRDKYKTDTTPGGAQPKWNEECLFTGIPATDVGRLELCLSILHKDTFRTEVVGAAVVSWARLAHGVERGWQPLVRKGKAVPGELSFECTWMDGAEPSPLDPAWLAAATDAAAASTAAAVPAIEVEGATTGAGDDDGKRGSKSKKTLALLRLRGHGGTDSPSPAPSPMATGSDLGLHAAAAASVGTLGAGAAAPVAGGTDAASPPDITGLSPNNGPESGDTAVTIRGDHLGRSPADVVQVLIAGVDCTHGLTWMSSHKLMTTTRAGIGAGEGPVTVVTRSGGRGVSTLLYRYVPLEATPAHASTDAVAGRAGAVHGPSPVPSAEHLHQVENLKRRLREREQELATLKEYVALLLTKIIDQCPAILEDLSRTPS